MKYVIDSSVGFKWAVTEIDSDKALRLLTDYQNAVHELLAPDLFGTEIANALASAEKSGRIQPGEAAAFLTDIINNVPVLHPTMLVLNRALEICLAGTHAVYDCVYIALAEREACHAFPTMISEVIVNERQDSMNNRSEADNPLRRLDDWEDFVEERYPVPAHKAREDYRNYDNPVRDTVREFYRLNHRYQTYDFVQQKKREFLRFDRRHMTVLEALDFLDTLVDDSDPDIGLSQREHLLQAAEAIRADGHEDWFVLTGLIHDLGKVLCLFGEPQWAVVGDTFPVGCAFSDRIVYPEFFADNPDRDDPRLQSPCGVYGQGCGLRNVHLSWGHDEYLYQVVKDHMPEPALYMIRYHSCYAWHRESAYEQLLDDHDRRMLPWVRKFNPYDLYSKSPVRPDWDKLSPYYTALIDKYLPGKLRW